MEKCIAEMQNTKQFRGNDKRTPKGFVELPLPHEEKNTIL